jgi:DNA adenine methylase
LINVYQIIRDNPQELISFLKKKDETESRIPNVLVQGIENGDPLPAKKELHHFFKHIYKPSNQLERAGRWFYLNRTSYNGIMNIQNMYWGYGDKFSMQPKNWPQNILRTSEKLQEVMLSNWDFEYVIDNAPDGALLFIDPPYFNADQDQFYSCSFTKHDHYRLEEAVRRNNDRLSLFITYDNHPDVRDLYGWMLEMHDKEWNYFIQRTDDQKNGTGKKGERYKGKELFILNYNTEEITERYQHN